jgi:hypothetical protein
MTSNMDLWDKVSNTPEAAKKSFKGKGGFSGTAISAQWQRKQATQVFGPFGQGWGLNNANFTLLKLSEDPHDSLIAYTAELFYTWNEKVYSFPICSEISCYNYSTRYKSWSQNNDMYKKVATDALTKGLSFLGFNSDVFEGNMKFDDNKHINIPEIDTSPKPKEKDWLDPTHKNWPKVLGAIEQGFVIKNFEERYRISKDNKEVLQQIIEERKANHEKGNL